MAATRASVSLVAATAVLVAVCACVSASGGIATSMRYQQIRRNRHRRFGIEHKTFTRVRAAID